MRSAPADLITAAQSGLQCPSGGFSIDPSTGVDLAIVTHAHADHAAAGSKRYIASPPTAAIMRSRLGADLPLEEMAFGERRTLGDVCVSLHPAGHVLGSAQVRIEPIDGGPVWCVTGDYKIQPDPTTEPFEPVACDVFVTETTFGLPIYKWPDPAGVFEDMRAWWASNASHGRTSVVFAYSLGKAQRVLHGIGSDHQPGAIGVHGAVQKICDVYRSLGVDLPETVHANKHSLSDLKGTGLIIAPPSQLGTPWLRKFAGPAGMRTAMASGWMAVRGRQRWRSLDAGFVLSDHVDWAGLLETIEQTGATRIGTTHGSATAVARYLREARSLDAFVLPTRRSDTAEEAD